MKTMKTPSRTMNLVIQNKFIQLIILLLTLSSCTSTAPHRTTIGDYQVDLVKESWPGEYKRTAKYDKAFCTDEKDPTDPLCESTFYRVNSDSASAHMAVVEFDDQGYLQNKALYQKTLNRIRDLHEAKGALMVVFAHGWKHNASFDDQNLIEFEKMLLEINDQDRNDCGKECDEERETIGVFLAWRGSSINTKGVENLSFWSRKKKAQRVGQDGAIHLLADLGTINESSCRDDGDCSENRFIIIGHSFGGAIIYAATRQRLVADLAYPDGDRTIGRSVADLVVLINPAFEAARYHGIEQSAKNHSFPPQQRPIFVAYTSEKDIATKKAFWWGRTTSTLFVSYRDGDQKDQNRTALGHYQPFITHRLELNEAYDESQVADYNLMACQWSDFRSGTSNIWNVRSTQFRRTNPNIPDDQITNPYLIVAVDPQLIPDHSNIWKSELMEHIFMLISVEYMQGCYQG